MMESRIKSSGYISAWTSRMEEQVRIFDNISHLVKNIVPDPGRDWMHAQLYTNTSAGTKGANHIGVSETTDAPDESWTETDFRTLHGEIASGGLSRAAASPAPTHIAGTNVSLVEVTYTPAANFPAVQVVGLLTAASGSGVLVHVGRLDQVASVVSGQSFRVLSTINHG